MRELDSHIRLGSKAVTGNDEIDKADIKICFIFMPVEMNVLTGLSAWLVWKQSSNESG